MSILNKNPWVNKRKYWNERHFHWQDFDHCWMKKSKYSFAEIYERFNGNSSH